MKKMILAAAAALALAIPAKADTMMSFETEDDYQDALFALESAIVGRGLVIDSRSHTGDMLERTKKDVGGTKTIFKHADIFSFCSAKLSRQVMEKNPMNLVFCPYDMYVFQVGEGDKVRIGFRKFPDGEMKVIEKLLESIAKEAAGAD